MLELLLVCLNIDDAYLVTKNVHSSGHINHDEAQVLLLTTLCVLDSAQFSDLLENKTDRWQ